MTACIVFKVIIQQVPIRVQIVITGFHGVSATHDFVVITDTIAIGIYLCGQRCESPGPEQLFPVCKAITICILIIIITMTLSGSDRT